MNIAAFSTATGAVSVMQATGIVPIVFPPMTADAFDPRWLEGHDMLYFHLHGLPNQEFWYGDNWITAISAIHIRQANLTNTIAFVANCHGLDSKMEAALLKAGARAVITGPGKNDTVKGGAVRGADLLGARFIGFKRVGASDEDAFRQARQSLRLRALVSPLERDAMGFQLKLGA